MSKKTLRTKSALPAKAHAVDYLTVCLDKLGYAERCGNLCFPVVYRWWATEPENYHPSRPV